MTIALMVLTMIIEGANSLKDKRMVISGLKEKLRRRFNVSLLESDHQDLWQKSELSLVMLSPSHRQSVEQLDEIERFIFEQLPEKEIAIRREYMDGV